MLSTLARLACACATAMACGIEAAPEFAPVGSDGCAPLLPPVREHEPLSQLLRRLADSHGFRLEYWAADDPPVRHGGGNVVEVIGALARDANMVVRYAAQPGCAAPWRVSAVWVLRTGTPTLSGPRPGPVAPAPPDQATDAFLRAHGLAPAGPAASASEALR